MFIRLNENKKKAPFSKRTNEKQKEKQQYCQLELMAILCFNCMPFSYSVRVSIECKCFNSLKFSFSNKPTLFSSIIRWIQEHHCNVFDKCQNYCNLWQPTPSLQLLRNFQALSFETMQFSIYKNDNDFWINFFFFWFFATFYFIVSIQNTFLLYIQNICLELNAIDCFVQLGF